ncbi:sensor histidine kinase [Ilumatobacter nonamiensis]|uniref:sensor histidine kinase n=1 Tax=Ilumatobacter nonamiensis TaxID=467093 RepID=UPI00034C3202|nr:HAMP domain-containing sensor histidine kinase [Ilumatobacter nonamiensis]
MTRRRALALVFGALVAVFVIGSAFAITSTRNQLLDNIDDNLANQLELNAQVLNSFTPDALDEIDVRNSPLAITVVDEFGQIVIDLPAGPITDPEPPPDLPPSRIIDRSGTTFTVDGTDDGPKYRVAVDRLDNGSHLAVSAPLDEVNETLRVLGRTLFITLVSMMVVLGAIFWLLLRASLRPYDELVDTAEAIADGDMDRRAVQTTPDPDIARLTSSLNTMLDRLQASFEERQRAEDRVKQFAADASHELRTPLTTIAGYSEVYLSGAATDSESVHKQMTRINSEANRMGRLVNDLLALARLDQGRGLEFHPVEIGSLVADVVTDAQAIDPAHALSYVSSADEERVSGDRDALQQVFVNLVANTAVHAPGSNVDVAVTAQNGVVTITVADDGPGMSTEVAASVFDRFFRAEGPRATSARGSGLGLSIVAAIVEAHGGTITAESELGTGSTFTVVLPTLPPS